MKKIQTLLCLALVGAATLASCSNDDNATTPFVTGENHIVLEGEDNMRDLGGFVGTDGKRIVYNKLFRSGELSHLTSNDLNLLGNKEVEQIIDLRTDQERTDSPDKTIYGTTRYDLPLIADVTGASGGQEELMAMILQGQVSAQEYMTPLYANIDQLKITNWTKIFDLLESGKTTLWHCTAGKDRAGMTTALVLSSLGVDRETIIEDFLMSNTYLSTSNQQTVDYINSQYGQGVGELLLPLLGVEEVYITTFFNAIDTQYGSMDNFLNVLGADREKMRSNFLEK